MIVLFLASASVVSVCCREFQSSSSCLMWLASACTTVGKLLNKRLFSFVSMKWAVPSLIYGCGCHFDLLMFCRFYFFMVFVFVETRGIVHFWGVGAIFLCLKYCSQDSTLAFKCCSNMPTWFLQPHRIWTLHRLLYVVLHHEDSWLLFQMRVCVFYLFRAVAVVVVEYGYMCIYFHTGVMVKHGSPLSWLTKIQLSLITIPVHLHSLLVCPPQQRFLCSPVKTPSVVWSSTRCPFLPKLHTHNILIETLGATVMLWWELTFCHVMVHL